MKTIGFLTPYKHLPAFKSKVEKQYKCIEIEYDDIKTVEVDYLFVAPNYVDYTITEEVIKDTNIQAILTPSTGTNHIDVNTIPIVSIAKDNILKEIRSTAEHNLYLILTAVRLNRPIQELSHLNLGILGYGRLGRILHELCQPLFNEVYISDLEFTDDDFFDKVDVLSINIDLNKNNLDFINKDYINKFTKDLFIINTARGEVVNEYDIVELLRSDKVRAYSTDVIKGEYTGNPFLRNVAELSDIYSKLYITPHIGGTAIQAQELAYSKVIDKI